MCTCYLQIFWFTLFHSIWSSTDVITIIRTFTSYYSISDSLFKMKPKIHKDFTLSNHNHKKETKSTHVSFNHTDNLDKCEENPLTHIHQSFVVFMLFIIFISAAYLKQLSTIRISLNNLA